jgi:very-short-patch-repair endonuclease
MGEKAYSVARRLRKRQTEAEKAFWAIVRNRSFMRLKFYRQHPICFEYNNRQRFFIADFYCHRVRLVVEIDGVIHQFTAKHDRFRDGILSELGYHVMHIKNSDVLKYDLVIRLLEEELELLL